MLWYDHAWMLFMMISISRVTIKSHGTCKVVTVQLIWLGMHA